MLRIVTDGAADMPAEWEQSLKPILMLRDGLLDVADKVRTCQCSLENVLHRLHDRFGICPVTIAVVNAADLQTAPQTAPQSAQSLLKPVEGALDGKEAILTELAIPVAANLGPGAIGVVAYSVEEER